MWAAQAAASGAAHAPAETPWFYDPTSSQPPAVSGQGAEDGSEISFNVSASSGGAPPGGAHAWRVPAASELAAVTPADAGAAAASAAPAGASAAAQEPAAEPATGEGIAALTAALLGPVRRAMRQVHWGDTLEDPDARDVVQDLIQFVWGRRGTGGSGAGPSA